MPHTHALLVIWSALVCQIDGIFISSHISSATWVEIVTPKRLLQMHPTKMGIVKDDKRQEVVVWCGTPHGVCLILRLSPCCSGPLPILLDHHKPLAYTAQPILISRLISIHLSFQSVAYWMNTDMQIWTSSTVIRRGINSQLFLMQCTRLINHQELWLCKTFGSLVLWKYAYLMPRRKNISHIKITTVSKNPAEGKSVMTSMTGSSLPENHLKDFFQIDPAQKLAAGLLSCSEERQKARARAAGLQRWRKWHGADVSKKPRHMPLEGTQKAESSRNHWLVYRVYLTFSLPSLSPPPEFVV